MRSGLHRGLRIMLDIAGCGDICAITVAPPKISPRVFSDKLERFWRLHFATLDIFGWSEISPIPHWDDPKTCPMLSCSCCPGRQKSPRLHARCTALVMRTELSRVETIHSDRHSQLSITVLRFLNRFFFFGGVMNATKTLVFIYNILYIYIRFSKNREL